MMMQRRLAFVRAISLVVILTLLMTGLGLAGIGEDEALPSATFARFVNALLTSYLVTSLFLLGAMVFYADSRDRPFAPLIGMLVAGLAGAVLLLTVASEDALMEGNSNVLAQVLWNLLRLFTVATSTGLAMLLGLLMVVALRMRGLVDVGPACVGLINTTSVVGSLVIRCPRVRHPWGSARRPPI